MSKISNRQNKKFIKESITSPEKELPVQEKLPEHKERKKRSGLSWYSKWKSKRNPENSYLIEMLYSNGTTKEFLIVARGETFEMNKRTYYIRHNDARYNLSMGEYKLYYDEDVAVPIGRDLVMQKDEKATTDEEKVAFFAVTPHNLKPFIKMEYVKNVVESSEYNKFFKMLLIMSFINTVIVIFVALKVLRTSGAG